jgi:protein-L-isoaspartate O-methyltransferase
MSEELKGKDVDVRFVTAQIPWVMNALYDAESFESVTLAEIRDAFRLKQMQSKAWMMSKIKDLDKSKRVLVIGSWLGFTSLCLRKLGFNDITETDPDVRLSRLAQHLNRHWDKFIHLSDDVNNIELANYDLIINTSCEHIADNTWYDRIPVGTTVVLHSNNLPGYDHVNTCENIHEMINKYPMDVSYSGSLDLEQYTRFMLIGTKT